jgi:four helix bundle protein
MTAELKERTKQFALKVIHLVNTFPRNKCADIIGRQLIKSATSVGANYRSACRGQTRAQFIAKMNITLEESDESEYWLELSTALGYGDSDTLQSVLIEAHELTAIFIASIKTARQNIGTSRRS